MYVNRHFNHYPVIIKQLPKTISKATSAISFNEDIFYKAASLYNTAMKFFYYTENIIIYIILYN